MNFLPYAPTRKSSVIASLGGSTAIHGAVLFGMLTSSVALLPEPTTPAVREPEYEITLEILDAEIIDLDEVEEEEPLIPPDAVPLEPTVEDAEELIDSAEALAPEDETAALAPEEEALDPVEDALAPIEEELPEPEVEELAALEPEPELPEIPEAEPVEPEVIAPEPELPEVVEEEPLAPEVVEEEPLPDPEPIAPVATLDPDDVAIDDLSLIEEEVFNPLAEGVAPTPETLEPAPLAPDVVVPEVSSVEEDIAAVVLPEPEVIVPEPEVIAPEPEIIEPEPEAEPVAPAALPLEEEAAAPEPEPEVAEGPEAEAEGAGTDGEGAGAPGVIANPSQADQQIGALIQRIRSNPAPQCVLALPRRTGDGGAAVSLIGAEVAELDALGTRIVSGLTPTPAQTREVLDARQCATLDAIRVSASYPASRIGLSVEDTTLNSGESLKARVVGAGGLFLTLLLVDDNGVVQDLARFTTLDGDDPVIDVPVARSGPARDTRQLLVVLGSPDAPIDVSAGIGRDAQQTFAGLPRDVLESAVFGVVTIDVR